MKWICEYVWWLWCIASSRNSLQRPHMKWVIWFGISLYGVVAVITYKYCYCRLLNSSYEQANQLWKYQRTPSTRRGVQQIVATDCTFFVIVVRTNRCQHSHHMLEHAARSVHWHPLLRLTISTFLGIVQTHGWSHSKEKEVTISVNVFINLSNNFLSRVSTVWRTMKIGENRLYAKACFENRPTEKHLGCNNWAGSLELSILFNVSIFLSTAFFTESPQIGILSKVITDFMYE